MRHPRRTRALLTLLVGAALLPAGGGLAAPQHPSNCATPGPGLTAGSPPPFGVGQERAVSTYLVDRWRRNLLLATNGTTILASTDLGCHWRRAFTTQSSGPTGQATAAGVVASLAALPDGSLVAAINPAELSVSTRLGADSLKYLTPGVAVSSDGGATWDWRYSAVPTGVRRLTALATAAEPTRPSPLYAVATDVRGQTAVLRTDDAGTSWRIVSAAGSSGRDADAGMLAVGTDANHVWVAGQHLSESTDGGRTFVAVAGTPGVVGEIQPGGDGSLVVVTDRGLWRRAAARWSRLPIPDRSVVTGAAVEPGGTVWATLTLPNGGAVVSVDRSGRLGPVTSTARNTTLDLVQATALPDVLMVRATRAGSAATLDAFNGHLPRSGRLPRVDAARPVAADRGCLGPGAQTPPTAWNPAWQPMPANEPWLFLTDFKDGGTFRVDRYGNSAQVGVTPGTPEGTALDPYGRIILSTRYAGELLRMDPHRCTLEVLDSHAPYNESPTFDSAGNLYLSDTDQARIWEYPWPQTTHSRRLLVHDFKADTDGGAIQGIEDVRVAPAGSPHAGDVFVQVFKAALTSSGGEVAETVERLHPGAAGRWVRSTFWTVPHEFASVGMAFLPDGQLLVPDIEGSGRVLRVSADGRATSTFATATPSAGSQVLSRQLAKIDVTPSGMVYVTAPSASDGSCNAGQYTDLGGAAALYRFAPDGLEVDPPFTSIPVCDIGISVIHLFPQLPGAALARHRLALPPASGSGPLTQAPAAAAAYATASGVNPPPQAVSQPQPQPQGQSQTQPQTQSQSQPGRVLGFAAGLQPEEQLQVARETAGDDAASWQGGRPHDHGGGTALLMSAAVLTAAASGVALRRRTGTTPARRSSAD